MWFGENETVVFCNNRSNRSSRLSSLKRSEQLKLIKRFKRAGLLLLVIFLLEGPAHAAGRLYYFWSFSMPEESLKAVFADGEKVGLVAVLRGLPEGSAKESLLRIKKLMSGRSVEIVIDPLLFRLYGITTVPTLVYAENVNPSCEHCEPAPRHWKAEGDVSLPMALENLARSVPPVEPYLRKLREGFFTK
jgi:type-F conjugative transfer system pilin assembly protein TrbC